MQVSDCVTIETAPRLKSDMPRAIYEPLRSGVHTAPSYEPLRSGVLAVPGIGPFTADPRSRDRGDGTARVLHSSGGGRGDATARALQAIRNKSARRNGGNGTGMGFLQDLGPSALTPRLQQQMPRLPASNGGDAGARSPRPTSHMPLSARDRKRTGSTSDGSVADAPSEVAQLLASLYSDKEPPAPRLSGVAPPSPQDKPPVSPERGAPSQQTQAQLLERFGLVKERAVGHLQKLRWFRYLTMAQITALLDRGRHRSYARYSYVAREGARSSGMTLLLEGQAESSSQANQAEPGHLKPGFAFGEAALVTAAPLRHEMTIKALSDTYTVTLTHADVEGLRLAFSVADYTAAHARIFGALPFFSALAPARLRQLGALVELQSCRIPFTYPEPTPLVREGEEAPLFFLLQVRLYIYILHLYL